MLLLLLLLLLSLLLLLLRLLLLSLADVRHYLDADAAYSCLVAIFLQDRGGLVGLQAHGGNLRGVVLERRRVAGACVHRWRIGTETRKKGAATAVMMGAVGSTNRIRQQQQQWCDENEKRS